MKNAIRFTLFVIAFPYVAFSQTPDFNWVEHFSGPGHSVVASTTVASDASIIVGGYSDDLSDVPQLLIAKYYPNGTPVWTHIYGSNYNESVSQVAVDSLGNVYAMGRYEASIDIDPGPGTFNLPGSIGSQNLFIMKLDPMGNFLWAKSFGAPLVTEFGKFTLGTDGNIFIVGDFEGTIDLDPGSGTDNVTSSGYKDIFLVKLSNNGDYVWGKRIGGSMTETFGSIALDGDNTIYVNGLFRDWVDFDPGPDTSALAATGSGNVSGFLLKLDSAANFHWVKQIGTVDQIGAYDIAINSKDEVYVSGYFNTQLDFDIGSGTAILSGSLGSGFFAQYDTTGNFHWAKELNTAGTNSGGYNFSFDVLGNPTIAGYFGDSVDLDPSPSTYTVQSAGTNGSHDIFFAEYNSNGDFQWGERIGGAGADVAYDIHIDQNNAIFLGGYFQSNVDFDPGPGTVNLFSPGGSSWDGYLLKLNQCMPTFATDNVTACGEYTWVDGNTYTTSNNSASYTLTNNAGCDSIVTLDLTITTADASVTQLDALTLQANASGAIYQWLDCDDNYTNIGGATDQIYAASSNGNYAVMITENGCSDTSACFVINEVGSMENSGENEVIIYPNPTNGELHIKLGKNYEAIGLNLRNTLGELVYHQHFSNTEQLDLNVDLPSGVYYIELNTDDAHKAMIRIILNKNSHS